MSNGIPLPLIQKLDGAPCPNPVEINTGPVFEDQRPSDVIAIQADPGGRRDAEIARRAAEEDLQAVAELVPGVIYRACVTASHIERVSVFGDLAGHLDGMDSVRAVGATVSRVVADPASVQLLHSLASDSEQAGRSVDIRVQSGSGAGRWLRNTARVIRRSPSQVELVGYIADVTLEKDVQLRLCNMQTLTSWGEMATGLVHELNQPLASISFAAQNAISYLEGPDVNLYAVGRKLKKIASESSRASNLIENMRIFARYKKYDAEAISVSMALDRALEILEQRLAHFTLHHSVSPTLPKVMGAAIPLEQVFINLLMNAMDAYDSVQKEVGRSLRLLMVEGGLDGQTLVLRIADRAGGIPPQVLKRLFDPFATTKSPRKGTGLGLALSFSTITAMGGTLTGQNEAGGAVFEIRLPVVEATAVPV